MFDAVLFSLEYIFFLSLCGLGLYLWLCPASLRQGWTTSFLLPCYGLGLTIWINALCLAMSVPLAKGFFLTLILSLVAAGAYVLMRKSSISKTEQRPDRFSVGVYAFVVLAGLAILVLPLAHGYSTRLAIRLGVDGALYLAPAQFLSHGGTLSLPMPDLSAAALIVHKRWGVPLTLANAGIVSRVTNVYTIGFCVMAVVSLMIALTTGLFAKMIFGVQDQIAWLIAFLLLLNINLLNVLFEAQWAQLQGMVFALLFILLIGQLAAEDKIPHERIKTIGSMALFWAAFFCSYSESLFLVGAFVGGVGLIELGRAWTDQNKALFIRSWARVYSSIGLAVVAGFLLVFPYSKMMLLHTLGLKVTPVGYWVPHWAMPSEILGMVNIYRHFDLWSPGTVTALRLHRSHMDRLVNTTLSIAILISFLGGVIRSKGLARAMGLAALGLTVLMYYYCIYRGFNNYVFMKAYVFLLPIGHAFFWIQLLKPQSSKTARRLSAGFAACLIVMIVASSHAYIREFRQTAEPIDDGFISLSKAMTPQVLGDTKYVFLPRPRGLFSAQRHMVDRTIEFYMLPLLNQYPLVDADAQTVLLGGSLSPYSDYRVCLLLRKKECPDWMTLARSKYPILWQNDSWLVINSKLRLKDIQRSDAQYDFLRIWSLYPGWPVHAS